MIPVAPQPEPAGFDAQVRQPGLAAFAAGQMPAHWRRCLPDLERAYDGVCAYLSIAITPGTGARTVDHFLPKRHHPQLAYEWSNFRLACGRMNARKGDHQDVLDPFTIAPGTFTLDFADLTLAPGPHLDAASRAAAEATIDRLQLNCPESCRARERMLDLLIRGRVTLDHIAETAPFLHQEWTRQGLALP